MNAIDQILDRWCVDGLVVPSNIQDRTQSIAIESKK